MTQLVELLEKEERANSTHVPHGAQEGVPHNNTAFRLLKCYASTSVMYDTRENAAGNHVIDVKFHRGAQSMR